MVLRRFNCFSLLLLLLVGKSTYAGFEFLPQKVLVGAFNEGDYSGPTSPNSTYNLSTGTLESRDDRILFNETARLFPYSLIQNERFLEEDLITNSSCPSALLAKHLDYIRYLYRLLALGLLYESLLDYQHSLEKLQLHASNCTPPWKEIFSKCKPKGQEMIKFKERAQIFVAESLSKNLPQQTFLKSEQKKWIQNLIQAKNKIGQKGISYARILAFLEKEKMPISKISLNSLGAIFDQICHEDISTFETICSERDEFYGYSDSRTLLELLIVSNTFKLINEEGYGKGCLERFIKLFSFKEDKISYLSELFSEVSYYLNEAVKNEQGDIRYLQGRLFIAGALKEFDDKGLVSFIFKKPPPKPTPSPLPQIPPQIAVAPKRETPVATPIPPLVTPPVLVAGPTPLQTAEPTPSKVEKSHFEIVMDSVRNFQKSGNKEVTFKDLILKGGRLKDQYAKAIFEWKRPIFPLSYLKEDYHFSDAILKILNMQLQIYKVQSTLREMCKSEGFGKSERPVPLSYLKFLIEFNDHHALFNLQKVLGEIFFIQNDIERKEYKVLVQMVSNSESGEWELLFLPIVVNASTNENGEKVPGEEYLLCR